MNRKDVAGKHIFAGGFLGLDNISLFDRSKPLPGGGTLEQADGTAWMAFYCVTMLAMALELAHEDPAYEDVASKFFEHFVAIADAMNTLGGSGLWDEQDGFYYDQLQTGGKSVRLPIRSLVGIIPLLAVEVLDDRRTDRLSGFRKRLQWFLDNRRDLARHVSYMVCCEGGGPAASGNPFSPSTERVLRYVLDENEFLSPFGVRSLSRVHKDKPFICSAGGVPQRVDYEPGESISHCSAATQLRGPIGSP